jgi:hypothetical protein
MTCKPCEEKKVIVQTNKTQSPKQVEPVITVQPETHKPIVQSDTHCPTEKITHIAKVGDKIVVTMDNCVFHKTKLSKLDIPSFSTINKVVTKIEPAGKGITLTFHNQITGEEKTELVEFKEATTATAGIVRLATETEALAGEHETSTLTPKTSLLLVRQELKIPDNLPSATKEAKGIVQLATVENLNQLDEASVTTPADVQAMINKYLKKQSETAIHLVGNDGTQLGFLIKEFV